MKGEKFSDCSSLTLCLVVMDKLTQLQPISQQVQRIPPQVIFQRDHRKLKTLQKAISHFQSLLWFVPQKKNIYHSQAGSTTVFDFAGEECDTDQVLDSADEEFSG